MMTSNTNLNTRAQGFKKKTSTSNTDFPAVKPADKLSDLKSKLQKQKQMMKKTGKRFREDNSISTQQISISTDKDMTVLANQNQNLNKHDISIGSQQPIKQTISLKDISVTDKSSKKQSLISSQLFQKQMKQQKKRSKEVHEFLKTIQLQSFAQSLINNGFDEVETLADLTTQDLNMVMMRAHQQIRLLQSIKSLKPTPNPKQIQTSRQQFSNTSTLWRLKTEPLQYPSSSSTSRVKSSQILARLKTEQGKQQQSSALKAGSFLYTVGARNWSVEDQVRKACSVCFKVQQQMEKKGDCFYCANCYKFVSGDLLQISLGKTMNKEYRKYQKQ